MSKIHENVSLCKTEIDNDGDILMLVKAKWVLERVQPCSLHCKKCYPESKHLIDGFKCYYHTAESLIREAKNELKNSLTV